jgi:hypothetical protein
VIWGSGKTISNRSLEKKLQPHHRNLRDPTPYISCNLNPKIINRWRPAMTSAHALPSMVTKVLYFPPAACGFVFVSMLLLTGLQ